METFKEGEAEGKTCRMEGAELNRGGFFQTKMVPASHHRKPAPVEPESVNVSKSSNKSDPWF